MPYNIDPNKMQQTINNMFGQGAYQNRMNTINNIAKLSAQKDMLQNQYDQMQKLQQQQAKQQQAAAQKKTYADAVDQLMSDPSSIQQDGAYKTAEEIRNDPLRQQAIKDQGYNVSDYINALYNVASNGKFRSEREFNQYNSALKKQAKAKSSGSSGIDQMIQNAQGGQTQSNSSQPKQNTGHQSTLGRLFSDLVHPKQAVQDIQKGYDRLITPVSHGVLNVEKQDLLRAKNGQSTNVGTKIQDFLNGMHQQNISGKDVMNASSIKNPVVKNLGGGILDFTSNPLNAVPYVGAEKLLGEAGLNIGSKLAEQLAPKYGNVLSNAFGKGIQGMATGALGASADATLNPNLTPQQRMSEVAQMGGLGMIGGALHGAVGSFFNSLSKSAPEHVQPLLALPDPQKALPEPVKGLPEPLYVNQELAPNKAIPGVTKAPSTPNPYPAKFEQLVNDFNQLQSEGKVTPGREYEVAKEMWSQMAGPHDPSFENMLKLANDSTKKAYSPQEKADLVKQARQNQHNNIYGVQNIMSNLPKNQPGTMRVPLNYVGNITNPVKQMAVKANGDLNGAFENLNNISKKKETSVNNEPQAININSQEPPLKRLTNAEMIQNANKDQFAQNNSDPTIPDTSSHIVSKKELKPSAKTTLDQLYTKTVDNLYPLSKFDKMVENVTGKQLKPSEKSHMLALNSRGSDQISKQILTKNLVNSKNEVIGKSLKDITSKLDDKQLKNFEDYLVNKHAITRMSRGEKVYSNDMKMSPEKSHKIVQGYEEKHPEFKQLAKEYYNYNKQLGKAWLVDTGILSKDEWQGYLDNNPYYVPNNRAFDPLEKSMNHNAKSGFANQTNPVKKATGSQRKIISPLESTIEHTAKYVKTAKRNEVMQSLIKNIQKNPEEFKGFAEIIKTDKTPQSILDTLNKEGVDGVLSELNKGFDQKPDLTHGNIVTGIVNGQKVHVRVNDAQLLDAIINLSPPEQNIVFKFFGKATRIMKNLTTGINPVFSLTRNIFRDIPQSYANSKSVNNPAQFGKDLISAFIDVVGNKEAYQSFKNFGGGHSSPISSDVNLLAQSKRAILKQKGIKPMLGKGLAALENLNNAVESAPRLAEYKRIAKPGDYNSQIKGVYEANDITTNFNKHGNFTKGLDSMVPYLNAAVQGLDKMVRQFKNNPKSTILKSGAAITLPTIVLYAVNHNNPNYQQLSNYEKDNYFVIPLSNGTFYKIAKPRELGMIFSTDIERSLRKWADSDPHGFQGFVSDVMTAFMPPVRSIVAPINDLRANKNFMGAPIVPGDLQTLSPKYQYDSQTSSVAKGLGNLLNKSPKQIDYLIKSYGGVLGQLGIPATSQGASVGSTLKNQVIADPVFSNDLLNNFYNEKIKLDQAHADFTKQGVTDKSLNEPLRKQFDSQSNNISKVRKAIKTVQSDRSLSNQDRQAKIRELQKLMNSIAQQTNQLVR